MENRRAHERAGHENMTTDLWACCALAAFVDALPLDDTHEKRSKKLAYEYYETELKKEKSNPVCLTSLKQTSTNL